MLRVEQDGVKVEAAVGIAQDGNREWDLTIAVDDLADHVCALVAEKQ